MRLSFDGLYRLRAQYASKKLSLRLNLLDH